MPKTYCVSKSSVDDQGRYNYCRTDSLAVAQAFAAKWVGPTPTLGSGYAICDYGVCKIEAVSGISTAGLFPLLEGDRCEACGEVASVLHDHPCVGDVCAACLVDARDDDAAHAIEETRTRRAENRWSSYEPSFRGGE
jgi:hypothetical protein